MSEHTTKMYNSTFSPSTANKTNSIVCGAICKRTLNHSGFTLIELMTVISIVGILSTVAVPKFQTFTTRAKFTELNTFAAKAIQEVELYYLEMGCIGPMTDISLPSFGKEFKNTLIVKKMHWGHKINGNDDDKVYLHFRATGPVPEGFIRIMLNNKSNSPKWKYSHSLPAKYNKYFPKHMRIADPQ